MNQKRTIQRPIQQSQRKFQDIHQQIKKINHQLAEGIYSQKINSNHAANSRRGATSRQNYYTGQQGQTLNVSDHDVNNYSTDYNLQFEDTGNKKQDQKQNSYGFSNQKNNFRQSYHRKTYSNINPSSMQGIQKDYQKSELLYDQIQNHIQQIKHWKQNDEQEKEQKGSLAEFLHSIQLTSYLKVFKDNQINNIQDLKLITKEDLQSMGVQIGPRNKILQEIRIRFAQQENYQRIINQQPYTLEQNIVDHYDEFQRNQLPEQAFQRQKFTQQKWRQNVDKDKYSNNISSDSDKNTERLEYVPRQSQGENGYQENIEEIEAQQEYIDMNAFNKIGVNIQPQGKRVMSPILEDKRDLVRYKNRRQLGSEVSNFLKEIESFKVDTSNLQSRRENSPSKNLEETFPQKQTNQKQEYRQDNIFTRHQNQQSDQKLYKKQNIPHHRKQRSEIIHDLLEDNERKRKELDQIKHQQHQVQQMFQKNNTGGQQNLEILRNEKEDYQNRMSPFQTSRTQGFNYISQNSRKMKQQNNNQKKSAILDNQNSFDRKEKNTIRSQIFPGIDSLTKLQQEGVNNEQLMTLLISFVKQQEQMIDQMKKDQEIIQSMSPNISSYHQKSVTSGKRSRTGSYFSQEQYS